MSFVQPSHIRAQSLQLRPETFQARATQMLKNIRGRFGGKITSQDAINGQYKHETRSMDVDISQPILGLQIDAGPTDGRSSRTASSISTAPAALCNNSPPSTWETLGKTPVRMAKSESVPAKARSNATGLVTNDRVTIRVQTAVGVPDIVVSGSPLPVEEIPNGGQTEAPSKMAPTTPAKILPTIKKNLPDVPRAENTQPPVLPAIDTSSRPPPTPQSSSPSPNVSPRRTTPRITDMPPSAFVMNRQGSVRLSPSIITRPTQPPFLLPKMPAPSSRPLPPPPKPQARLRSVPALSVDGTNELDLEADHDNVGLGDSDEDDEGDETNGGSDEDGEDLTHSVPTHSSHNDLRPAEAPTRRPDLPIINMTPFDLSLATPKSATNRSPTISRREWEMPAAASNALDYFSVKPLPNPSGARVDNATPGPSMSNRTSGFYLMTTPSSPAISRPTTHHQASRSMVDLTFPKELLPVKNLDNQKGKGKAPAQPDTPGPAPAYSEGALRRRRSMPIYNATSEPPPYPIFARRDHVAILPRDEEGKERLPDYSNSIHLTAIMPRKMEFSAPGVQAKDRKWRRTLCELEGTAFRVYKCPPGAAGVGVIGEWWEKKVGVGNVAISGASGSAVEDMPASETAERRPSKTSPDQRFSTLSISSGGRRTSDTLQTASPKPKGLAASLLYPVTRGGSSPARSRPHSRSQSEASGPGHRQSLGIARSATDSSSQLNLSPASTSNHSVAAVESSTGSETPSPSRSSFFTKPGGRNSVGSFNRPTLDLSNPDPADLIRGYTMQNAESGLGSDYAKRKNVIRVRMEGEQFLLQAQGVAEVVEWIEGFHAAANIALDLDERVMPKGPIFPRRRRRRRRADPNRTNPSTPSTHPAQS